MKLPVKVSGSVITDADRKVIVTTTAANGDYWLSDFTTDAENNTHLYADDNQRRRVWSRAKAFAASPINEITVKQGEAEARLIVRQLEARGVAAEAVERAGKWIVRKKGGSENG